MKKIGIFLDEITDSGISEGEKLSKLGGNTGNMLFWESLKANLNLEVIPRRYINYPHKLDLGRFSAFVTTDLIWIRQMQDFSYLNRVLDAIGELPLIPISIGLQCDHMLPDFRLHPETVKVIGRISERCVMGVRGEYTAEILRRHGIGNFMVIGCPSMYMNAAGLLSVGTEKKPVKRVSANFETFYKKLDKPRTDFLRYCAENELSFAEQTAAEISEKQIENPLLLKNVKGWLKNNSHIFFDINEWRSYIRELDFSIGARFHGNVIALWENVPALFLVTDSRTKELCEHFSLPHMNISDFDRSKPLEYYYELADYSEFHKNYPKRLAEWKEFLKVNGLENNKKRCLIYAKTVRQLLEAMLIAQSDCRDSDNILFVSAYLKKLYPDIDSVIGKSFFNFNKVVTYNTSFITNTETSDDDIFISDIERYYDKLAMENDIDINTVDEFYVFSSLRFSLYLWKKQKKFHLFEDSEGTASLSGLLQWRNIDKVNKEALVNRLGLMEGSSEYVKNIHICLNAQTKTFAPEKTVDFDLCNYIASTDKELLKGMLGFFNGGCNSFDKRVDYLLITQYYSLPKDIDTTVFWGLVLDLFTPVNAGVAIKPHPADMTDFKGIIPADSIVNKNIPFELLSTVISIGKLISYTSSASSRNIAAIRLGEEYGRYDLADIYAVLLTLELSGFENADISYFGEDSKYFGIMLENRFGTLKACGPSVGVRFMIYGHNYRNSDYVISNSNVNIYLVNENEADRYANTEKYCLFKAKTSLKPDNTYYFAVSRTGAAFDEKRLPAAFRKTMKYSGVSLEVWQC